MELHEQIREILEGNLSVYDKLIEIERALPKKPIVINSLEDFATLCGGEITYKEDGSVVIDGSKGAVYTDHPEVEKEEDLYYTGCGCTWDVDLNGERYWKLYDPKYIPKMWRNGYSHLKKGDIVNDDERNKRNGR